MQKKKTQTDEGGADVTRGSCEKEVKDDGEDDDGKEGEGKGKEYEHGKARKT